MMCMCALLISGQGLKENSTIVNISATVCQTKVILSMVTCSLQQQRRLPSLGHDIGQVEPEGYQAK